MYTYNTRITAPMSAMTVFPRSRTLNNQHIGFIPLIFSPHVKGSCITFRSASQIPLQGSMHALKGRKMMYHQARKPAIGQAANQRMRIQMNDQSSPGHIPPLPLPSPTPSPLPVPLPIAQNFLLVFDRPPR